MIFAGVVFIALGLFAVIKPKTVVNMRRDVKEKHLTDKGIEAAESWTVTTGYIFMIIGIFMFVI